MLNCTDEVYVLCVWLLPKVYNDTVFNIFNCSFSLVQWKLCIVTFVPKILRPTYLSRFCPVLEF